MSIIRAGVIFLRHFGPKFREKSLFLANFWKISSIHNDACFVKILEKLDGPILRSVEKNSFFGHFETISQL